MVSLNDVLLAMSNIPVDDPIAEMWGRGLQGGYEIIEYTGTLPITITADGNALIDYCIYGNTEQTGTPTPENPIVPIGCGERTENLFPQDFFAGRSTSVQETFNEISSSIIFNNGQYTFTMNVATNTNVGVFKVCFTYTDDTQDKSSWISNRSSQIVLVSNGAKVVKSISITDYNYFTDVVLSNIMLNSGSTAIPYEPYGYKLPMLSNSTVTNLYLGEVETTRRIKKLVLTGEENIQYNTQNKLFYFMLTDVGINKLYALYCSHFQKLSDNQELGAIITNSGTQIRIYDVNLIWQSVSDFKSYLAAQYAAGTPVTIWYVLAEPETAVVNEPLMKIGDYTDTVDSSQTAVQIPTHKGTTIIDYDGDPKPSQMYIKYRR